MTVHVSDGTMTHERDESPRYGVSIHNWLELTTCRLEYVREDHPLAGRIPSSVTRLRVTTDPVDCMTCLVRTAES